MKSIKLITTAITLLTFNITPALAQSLESDNYKIVDANTNSSGEVTNSTTGDYNLLNTVGGFTGDPRLFSNNYRAGAGIEIFVANTPTVSCFETDTNGSSQCTTGPTYLNTDGMVTVCGANGCYDRARFEINVQKNPTDTLYAVQISEDNFATDTRYIDGVTYKPKSANIRTLSDYKTKTDWETESTNIRGLSSSTQYSIRIVALHGDFTESEPGPSSTATTASAYISFDIDIADVNGTTAESTPPYLVEFSSSRQLVQTGPAQTAVDLIWMDVSTNALGGFALIHRGTYGGLFSTAENYTIPSDNYDLDGESEGFGIQDFYTSQERATGSGNGDLGTINVDTDYNGTTNVVGKVDQVFLRIYSASKPILNGRMGVLLKARASGVTPAASDYTEDITLIAVPRY
ncbi:MAG TPA: hypothetical protein PLV59_00575 [Candidatus Dojkabacteria bacterium]|nr:hypothetical protein [Candidatus Dojkabacteria bacterium]